MRSLHRLFTNAPSTEENNISTTLAPKKRTWSPARWKAQELLRQKKQLQLNDPTTAHITRTWSPARRAAQLARIKKKQSGQLETAPLTSKKRRRGWRDMLTMVPEPKIPELLVGYLADTYRQYFRASKRELARRHARNHRILKQLQCVRPKRKRNKNKHRSPRLRRTRKKRDNPTHRVLKIRRRFFRELYTRRRRFMTKRFLLQSSQLYQEKLFHEFFPFFAKRGWQIDRHLFRRSMAFIAEITPKGFRRAVRSIVGVIHEYAQELKVSAAKDLQNKGAAGEGYRPRQVTDLEALLAWKPMLGLDYWNRRYAIKFAKPKNLEEVSIREQYSVCFDELKSWKGHQICRARPKRFTSAKKSQIALQEEIARALPYCGVKVRLQAQHIYWVNPFWKPRAQRARQKDAVKTRRRYFHNEQLQTREKVKQRKRHRLFRKRPLAKIKLAKYVLWYGRKSKRGQFVKETCPAYPPLPWTYNNYSGTVQKKLARFLLSIERIGEEFDKKLLKDFRDGNRIIVKAGHILFEKESRRLTAEVITEAKQELEGTEFSYITYKYTQWTSRPVVWKGRYDQYREQYAERELRSYFTKPGTVASLPDPNDVLDWIRNTLLLGQYIFVLCEDLRERNWHALLRGMQWDRGYLQFYTQGDVQLLKPTNGPDITDRIETCLLYELWGEPLTQTWEVENKELPTWPEREEVFVSRKFDFREGFVILHISPQEVAADFRQRQVMKQVAAMELAEYKEEVAGWDPERDGPVPEYIPDRVDPTFIVTSITEKGMTVTPFTDDFIETYLHEYAEWTKQKQQTAQEQDLSPVI